MIMSGEAPSVEGLISFLLGTALMGRTHYLVTGMMALFVGFGLMHTSGQNYLKGEGEN